MIKKFAKMIKKFGKMIKKFGKIERFLIINWMWTKWNLIIIGNSGEEYRTIKNKLHKIFFFSK